MFLMNNHIVPVLGNKRMKTLNSADIYCLYAKLYKYSGSVADQARTILNTCLARAVEEKAMEVNIAKDIKLHRKEKANRVGYKTRKVEKSLSHEQVLKLIEGSKDSKIHLMILFNVIMGLRCSEIIGLKYSDVDFINQKLYVRRQLGRDIKKNDEELAPKTFTKQEVKTKTASSERTIDIPDIVFDAILQQRKKYEKCKSRRSTTFQDMGYICCSSYGRPRSKNFHYEEFKQLLRDLELPDVTWHSLRATCATQLLLQGLSPKAIARNLGHSKEIVTVDKYIDNTKVTTKVLDRLDAYIKSVMPKKARNTETPIDLTDIKLNISSYF